MHLDISNEFDGAISKLLFYELLKDCKWLDKENHTLLFQSKLMMCWVWIKKGIKRKLSLTWKVNLSLIHWQQILCTYVIKTYLIGMNYMLLFYFLREGRGKKCSVRTTISQNIPLVVLGFLRLAMVTLSGMSRVSFFPYAMQPSTF